MGINTDTFHKILMNGFGAAWNTTPIPQEDTSFDGQPRLSRRSLDAAGVLGLVLHYLGSSMLEISLQQIFALVPSTVSCYLNFAKQLLLDTLQQLPEASISFPKGNEFAHDTSLICQRHDLLCGAFGSIDGLALPVQEADDPEVENAMYNGWKASHFISNVIAFSPLGTLLSSSFITITNLSRCSHLMHYKCPGELA